MENQKNTPTRKFIGGEHVDDKDYPEYILSDFCDGCRKEELSFVWYHNNAAKKEIENCLSSHRELLNYTSDEKKEKTKQIIKLLNEANGLIEKIDDLLTKAVNLSNER